jgi:hypothetical protein
MRLRIPDFPLRGKAARRAKHEWPMGEVTGAEELNFPHRRLAPSELRAAFPGRGKKKS